jgi:hypothetical protein
MTLGVQYFWSWLRFRASFDNDYIHANNGIMQTYGLAYPKP